jgi:hypothetical protein
MGVLCSLTLQPTRGAQPSTSRHRTRYRGATPREPFTRDQLAYVERTAGNALKAWSRAMKHLDRIGASGHELYRVIREASNAEHALRVHAMYAKHDAEKRRE